jgi:hypothetical protein
VKIRGVCPLFLRVRVVGRCFPFSYEKISYLSGLNSMPF